MKGRVIVIDMPEDRGFAAALIVDGRLEDLILDPPEGTYPARAGDIHMAKITRKLPGSGGAFCALAGSEGFLRQAKGLKSGDMLLVQVVSLPEHGKAATVTPRVLFKGPRLILTPHAPGINASRQIRDSSEVDRLQSGVSGALESICSDKEIPEDCGVIIRTNAVGEETRRLSTELGCLADQYRVIRSRDNVAGGGNNAMQVALTEWLFPLPAQILCAPALARVLSNPDTPFGPMEFWGDERFLSLIRSEEDPFAAFDLHSQIASLMQTDVPVGDSSICIEQTRAAVMVDVNTGGDFSPSSGLKANLAAARDLPRQLRLRGLGGQIVVDFAAMSKKHRRTLEQALKAAFQHDPVETALVGWTSLGLYEIQRKRERRPLSEVH